jgi:hypothetical protein
MKKKRVADREPGRKPAGSAEKTQKTQLERAATELVRVSKMFPELAHIQDQLREVLDEAQNAPPQGASDGSIYAQAWNSARAVEKALNELLLSLRFTTNVQRVIPEGRKLDDARNRA